VKLRTANLLPLPLREGVGGGVQRALAIFGPLGRVRSLRLPCHPCQPTLPPLPLPPPARGGGKKCFRALTVLSLALLAGCHSQPASPLPRYPLTDAHTTLAAFSARAATVHSVQAEANVELTDTKKQTVHLDAALLLQPPDRIRLRAWKFGTAVFDLTVNDRGAFAFVPRDEARPAMPAARQSITQWVKLLNGQIASEQSRLTQRGDELVVDTPQGDLTLRCTIDRPTLTAERYELLDGDGKTRFTLALSDYQLTPAGPAWPMTIVATSEQGVIRIHATDVTLNEPLPPAAFDPPVRAERLP